MSKREPTEIEMIAIPVLLEAVCVTIAIGCAAMLLIVFATPLPI